MKKTVTIKFKHAVEYTAEVQLTEDLIEQVNLGEDAPMYIKVGGRYVTNPLYDELSYRIKEENITDSDDYIHDIEIIED